MHEVSDIIMLCKFYSFKVSLDVGSFREVLQEMRTHKYAGLTKVDRVILSIYEKSPVNCSNK